MRSRRKVIFITGVVNDGRGDVNHLTDIYGFLSPKMKDFEFIPIICCDEPDDIPYCQEKMNALSVPNYFLVHAGNFIEEFKRNLKLQKDIKEVEQIITISISPTAHIFNFFMARVKEVNPCVIIKEISEHERGPETSLGLSKSGIKIKKIAPIALEEMFTQQTDFAQQLLKHSHTQDVTQFESKNLLIPAYFNVMPSLVRFLLFLATNKKLPDNKDLAIYVSGKDLNTILVIKTILSLRNSIPYPLKEEEKNKLLESIKSEYKSFFYFNFYSALNKESGTGNMQNLPQGLYFEETNIKSIEIIEPHSEPIIYKINSHGSRVMRLFYGFDLSDEHYYALYQQAPIVGVSGDGSLEAAFACRVLPFYFSTNFNLPGKEKYLRILHSLIDVLEIDEKVRKDYLLYFNYFDFYEFNKCYRTPIEIQPILEAFANLDLIAMKEEWPKIADFIAKNHNFYDKLEDIVLKDVPEKPQPIFSNAKNVLLWNNKKENSHTLQYQYVKKRKYNS